ncbi:DUF3450 family protein [Pseudodesulfovibrio sediminis]|uniref:Biopolymer transporter ExbB n=1 Tax=Pseudodesulfovibrio sediminis TaxID=2810563 RepID=A0ABM7P5I1_9BACT|nr:DUF3450 family protein [Pseudodesulfovibrio sediminis]BCS88143.1 biopolymer transporter ExbB [Pseudodesulfovibrio sediminis]
MRLFLILFSLLIFTTPLLAAPSNSPSPKTTSESNQWRQTVGEIKELHEATQADAQVTIQSITQEQNLLTKELLDLKAEKRRRDQNYHALTQKFNSLVEQKHELDKTLESQQDSMRLIEGTVRTSAKQFQKRAMNSPVTAERPDRLTNLAQLLDSVHFPGLESIKTLTDMWFHELVASGEVITHESRCVAPDGSQRQGIVTRLGTLGALFKDMDGNAAFLRPNAGGHLEMVSGDFDNVVSKADQFLSGEQTDAPIDFSGGEVFKRFDGQSGILTTLMNGGMLIWPILLVGLIGFLLSGERFLRLASIHTCPDCKMDRAMEWASKGNLKQCADCLGPKGNTPTCRVISHVVLHSGSTLVSMEKGLQEAILQELPKLERFLPTINILAAVAPLLGLLGTVTGMIGTFQVITIFGTGDARMMSGGISEALITTQLGLAVAIPLTLMHHFLERKVDRMVADMEEKGTTLVARIISSEKGEHVCSTSYPNS